MEDIYRYTRDGKCTFAVVRYLKDGKKVFGQWTRDGDHWVGSKLFDISWPYMYDLIKDENEVLIVEGEKAAKAAFSLGIKVTTSPGGCNQGDKCDWSLLAGKDVWIMRDNDSHGVKYQKAVVSALKELRPKCSIHVIDPYWNGIKEKDDIADLITEHGEEEAKNIYADLKMSATVVQDKDELAITSLIKQTRSGERRSIRFGPHSTLSRGVRPLICGTMCVMLGDPSAGKSWMLLHSLIHLHQSGEKVCVLELEEDAEYWSNRLLALVTQDSRFLDDEFICNEADYVDEQVSLHHDKMAELEKIIYDDPDDQMTYDDVLEFIEARFKEGYKVVAVDPITAVAQSDKVHVSDQKFVVKVKKLARKYLAVAIILTHPVKGNSKMTGMERMSGAAAWSRLTQSAIDLEEWDEKKPVKILGSDDLHKINIKLRVTKARNSKIGKSHIGYFWDKQTMQFHEIGIIMEDKS